MKITISRENLFAIEEWYEINSLEYCIGQTIEIDDFHAKTFNEHLESFNR